MQQDDAVHAQTAPGSSMVLQIDKGIGKQFLLIIWLTAFISALAVIGLFIVTSAYRANASHTNMLQYDLAQIRAQLIEQGLYEPTGH